MAVRFLEPVAGHQAAVLRGYVDEALRALDVELDVPLSVVDRHGPDEPSSAPGVVGWANRRGVFLVRDLLERDDEKVRATVVEEVAHFWLLRAHPRLAELELYSETFACWFVGRTCGAVWFPRTIDRSTDRYQLGRAVGGALAGASEPRELLAAIGYDDLLRMLDRLDGGAQAQELAAQLVAELGGR